MLHKLLNNKISCFFLLIGHLVFSNGQLNGSIKIAKKENNPLCADPTNLQVLNVKTTSIDFVWDGFAASYEYVIDNSILDPISQGNLTSFLFVNGTNLSSNTTYYFHIRSICGSEKSSWVTLSATTSASPECTVLISPPNGSTEVVVDEIPPVINGSDGIGVKLTWTGISAIQPVSYTLFYGLTASLEKTPIRDITNTYRYLNVLFNKTYYWKVVAVVDNVPSTNCETYTFTTSGNDECVNAIPLIPSINFSDGKIVGSNISASLSNGLGDLVCYPLISSEADVWYSVVIPPSGNLTIETGEMPSGPGDGIIQETVIAVYSGTCNNLTEIDCNDNIDDVNGLYFSRVNLNGRTPGETIYVRVMGYGDLQGTYLISAYDVNVPICASPVNISHQNLTSSSVNLSWNSIASSVNYEYTIDNSPSNPSGNGITEISNNLNITNLFPNRTYYLHVRNNCGTYKSKWSTHSFMTLPPSVECVASTIPVNITTGVTVTNGSVSLSWTPSLTGNTPTRYDVFFGTDSNSLTKIVSDISQLSYLVNGILENTQYFWQVVPKYVSLSASNCTVNTFTTSSNLPNCASTHIPANASSNVSINAGSLILSWGAPTGGSSITGYDVYFGLSSNSLNLEIANTTSLSYQINGLSSMTQYFWKIVPKTGAIEALSCDTNSFTTTTDLSSDYFIDANFSYYPNPVESIINFINRDEITSIEVRDIMSKEILSRKINSTNYQLDMTGFERGTYFVKVTANSNNKTIKVLKK
jgi:hypothetical protein